MPPAPDEVLRLSPRELEMLGPEGRADYQRYLIAMAKEAGDWYSWLTTVTPRFFTAEPAEHHAQFWDWVYQIEPKKPSKPYIGIWGRGGAKSSSAELAVANLGARGVRKYCLYISGTQDQADQHVANIGGILESVEMEMGYPDMAEQWVGKFGNSRGWRRNRLSTKSGFVIDAVGLDTGARGVKVEEQRPDLIVFDDIDKEDDSPEVVEKKIRTLTTKILPIGSGDVVFLGIQNVIHPTSVFARLGRVARDDQGEELVADFLTDRIVSGPIPAAHGLTIERREDGTWAVTGGMPTWPGGQDLKVIEHQINQWGRSAFLMEAQHEVSSVTGEMFDEVLKTVRRVDWDEVPWERMKRTAVWVDPAVTDTKQSDSMGIQADAVTSDGVLWRLRSWEQRGSPLDAVKLAIAWAVELGADTVGIETDQGGDTWKSVYQQAIDEVRHDLRIGISPSMSSAWPAEYRATILRLREAKVTKIATPPRFKSEKAGAGYGSKVARAHRMLAGAYETKNKVVHVRGSVTDVLERALLRFPLVKPYDLVDASVWSFLDLAGKLRHRATVGRPARRHLRTPVRK